VRVRKPENTGPHILTVAVVDHLSDVVPAAGQGPQRHLQGVQRQLGGHRRRGAHPTMRRENTSETNAVNAIPDHVGT